MYKLPVSPVVGALQVLGVIDFVHDKYKWFFHFTEVVSGGVSALTEEVFPDKFACEAQFVNL